MKGVHENILDFEILETGNLKTLVFVDSSQYMENPEKPLLEIILPGMNKYLLVNIKPRKVNTFNSNTLNLTPHILNECELLNLSDGVYYFKYKICPYQYINRVKYYLRATNLLSRLNTVLDRLDFADCSISAEKEVKDAILDIYILIESAKASAELGNKERASDKYKRADKKVNFLLDKIKTKPTWAVRPVAECQTQVL